METVKDHEVSYEKPWKYYINKPFVVITGIVFHEEKQKESFL